MKSPGAFTVVIPTYNRVTSLDLCVRGIAAQDYASDQLQVIVVNDGGAEIPTTMQREWAQSLDITILTQTNAGSGAARNTGVEHAANEWIAFTDDDCVPAPDWLTQLAETLATETNLAIGGATLNGLPENVYSEASQNLILFLMDYYHRSTNAASQIAFFPTSNFALARETFRRVGGFNPTIRYAEERDLCARLRALGCVFRYVPAARVYHYRPLNLFSFWRQHQIYGQGAYQYQKQRAQATMTTNRPEPLRFYQQMLAYPMQNRWLRARLVSSLIALSQIANFIGYMQFALAARFGARK